MTPPLPDLLIEPIVRAALAEDLGRAGDITALACIDAEATLTATFGARKDGTIAGLDCARLAVLAMDPAAKFKARVADGDAVKAGAVLAKAYDVVLNGWELGGGSIRIHDRETQATVFRLLGLSDEDAKHRFGFFLESLEYGTPPHGGLALGLDRICALLCGESSIREVIAFPKTTQAVDLMCDAPSTVDPRQLRELNIKVIG